MCILKRITAVLLTMMMVISSMTVMSFAEVSPIDMTQDKTIMDLIYLNGGIDQVRKGNTVYYPITISSETRIADFREGTDTTYHNYGELVSRKTGIADGKTVITSHVVYDADTLKYEGALPSEELYLKGGSVSTTSHGAETSAEILNHLSFTNARCFDIEVTVQNFADIEENMVLFNLKFTVLQENFFYMEEGNGKYYPNTVLSWKNNLSFDVFGSDGATENLNNLLSSEDLIFEIDSADSSVLTEKYKDYTPYDTSTLNSGMIFFGGQNHYRKDNTVYYPYKNNFDFSNIRSRYGNVKIRFNLMLEYDADILEFDSLLSEKALSELGTVITIIKQSIGRTPSNFENCGYVSFTFEMNSSDVLADKNLMFTPKFNVLKEAFVNNFGMPKMVQCVTGTVYVINDGNPVPEAVAFSLEGDEATIGEGFTYDDLLTEFAGYIPPDLNGFSIRAKEGTSIKIWDNIKYITGLAYRLKPNDLISQIEAVNCNAVVDDKYVRTGTKVNLTDDSGEVIDTYTVIIYGDLNGDCAANIYDVLDLYAGRVSYEAIINGKEGCSKADLSPAVWAAADCNHDGVIDSNDSDMCMEDAGKYIDQSAEPYFDAVVGDVNRQKLLNAIELFESTDFSDYCRAAYETAIVRYNQALEVLSDSSANQNAVDTAASKLETAINKALQIKKTDAIITGSLYLDIGSSNIGNNPYFVWNRDTGVLNLYKGADGSNRVATMLVEVSGPVTPWKRSAEFVKTIVFNDNLIVNDSFFSDFNNLENIILLDTSIKSGAGSISTSNFLACSNPKGKPITVYGCGSNNQALANYYGFDFKDVSLYSYASNDENIVVDKEKNYIYGFKPFTDTDMFEYFSFDTTGCDIVAEKDNEKLGTGTKIDVVKWSDASVAESYTAIIFGDVDGDGIYNAQDAFIVNCIANGMLTREQVGEAKYTAADCNHDGEVNSSDVILLEQAGLLLSEVDQTASHEEMMETQAYRDYLDLIDQTPEKDEKPTASEQTFIEKIISVIRYIISIIISIIKSR